MTLNMFRHNMKFYKNYSTKPKRRMRKSPNIIEHRKGLYEQNGNRYCCRLHCRHTKVEVLNRYVEAMKCGLKLLI